MRVKLNEHDLDLQPVQRNISTGLPVSVTGEESSSSVSNIGRPWSGPNGVDRVERGNDDEEPNSPNPASILVSLGAEWFERGKLPYPELLKIQVVQEINCQ